MVEHHHPTTTLVNLQDDSHHDHYEENGEDSIQLTRPSSSVEQEEGTIEKYRVKRILIGERRTPIILQNLNGPCPLIAIFNILSLRGATIDAIDNFIVNGFITNENLVQLLAQSMLDKYNQSKQQTNSSAGNTGSAAGNRGGNINERTLQSALNSIPKLKHGLDVNVQFTEGVHGFSGDCDLSVFNFFNIKIMHGWLVDSETELEIFKALKGLSYDQAVEKIVLMNELINAEEKNQSTNISNNETNSETNEVEVVVDLKELKTPEEMVKKLSPQQKNEIISQGSLIQNFLNSTSSQLTEYGMNSIHNSLADRKIAIFFRNNHFSVICKIHNSILTLCTNETLLNETNIVWENLTIHGQDQQYYLGDFTPFEMLETHSQNYEYHHNMNSNSNGNNNNSSATTPLNTKQHDEDLQLALQLQREEEMAFQQAMIQEEQQNRRSSPPRQPQQQPMQNQSMMSQQQQQPMYSTENNAPRVSPRTAATAVVQTPLEQDPNIPYANVPTIREKKGGPNTTSKHGANAYASQASQLRELNKERRERELTAPREEASSKKGKKRDSSDCTIC